MESFATWKYFLKILVRQYRLIHILHLVNFDQSLSKSPVVRSMLNFEMFLANSDQETIQTIWFDLYFQHKVKADTIFYFKCI